MLPEEVKRSSEPVDLFCSLKKMKAGMTPQQACEFVVQRIIDINGGPAKVEFNVKMIAMNIQGESGVASVFPDDQIAPYASVISEKGLKVISGKAFLPAKDN